MEERFDSGKIGAGPGVDAEIFQGTIEFSKSGQTVRSLPGQTLLETAEANGIVLPYGCRQGQCGTCATRLVAGEVDSHGILDPDQGYVLACVSHARGDVQLDACNLSWNILDARRYIQVHSNLPKRHSFFHNGPIPSSDSGPFFLLISIALCRVAAAAPANAIYVGSLACKTCYTAIYGRWSKTRMANVVRDPRLHPDAILPDLSIADQLVTFTASDITPVYRSRWKQRYFKKVGDDYFALPAQWDVNNRVWRQYFVQSGTDWWTKYYPPDNLKRPTGPLCDGCHSVNYNIQAKSVTEWNVGCRELVTRQ